MDFENKLASEEEEANKSGLESFRHSISGEGVFFALEILSYCMVITNFLFW